MQMVRFRKVVRCVAVFMIWNVYESLEFWSFSISTIIKQFQLQIYINVPAY